jgi:hypothetical protein
MCGVGVFHDRIFVVPEHFGGTFIELAPREDGKPVLVAARGF